MPRYHNVEGNRVQFTDAEEAARDAAEATIEAQKPATAFEALRRERDRLLADTDWMSLSDSPAISDAWTQYRADLRALPSQYDNESILGTITFPTPPS